MKPRLHVQTARRALSALAATGVVAAAGMFGAPTAEAASGPVTQAQVRAIFGSRIANDPRVVAGLPALNQKMAAAGITTPARRAAFLATIFNESLLDPGATELGNRSRYKGRGYIQLTGSWNYAAAGKAIRVNLKGNPNAALVPANSAAIATWYWTQARTGTNAAADHFDMGRVSRNVGYAASSREDAERCSDFKRAYKVLSGRNAPSSTKCFRH